jgi:hypothetical protein
MLTDNSSGHRERGTYNSDSSRYLGIDFFTSQLLVVDTEVLPVGFETVGGADARQLAILPPTREAQGPLQESEHDVLRGVSQGIFWVIPYRTSGLFGSFYQTVTIQCKTINRQVQENGMLRTVANAQQRVYVVFSYRRVGHDPMQYQTNPHRYRREDPQNADGWRWQGSQLH